MTVDLPPPPFEDPFQAIRQHAKSRLDNHQQVYRLLQACESTMAEQGMARLPEHYFAILVSLLLPLIILVAHV